MSVKIGNASEYVCNEQSHSENQVVMLKLCCTI